MTNLRRGLLVLCTLSLFACSSSDTQGAQGLKGATGAQGPVGPQGPAGADGAQGPQGIQGIAGANGSNGSAGAQGIQGIAGPTGPTGPAGASAAGLVMKDGAGNTVKFTSAVPGTTNTTLYVVDADGYFWLYTPGQATTAQPAIPPTSIWYTTTDCTGTKYFQASEVRMARIPFKENDSSDNTFYVLPDAPVATSTQHLAALWNGSCIQIDNPGSTVYLVSDLTPATAITPMAIPQPVHFELP
jgi:hypothetical protein